MSTSCPSFKPPAPKSAWYCICRKVNQCLNPMTLGLDTDGKGDDTWWAVRPASGTAAASSTLRDVGARTT